MSHLPDFSEGRLSKKQWESLSPEELDDLALVIFDYYRKQGFPYYELKHSERLEDYNKLKAFFDTNRHRLIDEDNRIGMSMHGLALAWSYFPHSWDVKVGKMRTPKEVYDDNALLMAAIKKRFKRGTYFSPSGIRKALRTYSGTQSVSNFRPTAAAAIYDRYCPPRATVWDMSSGYGGRLLGAAISNKVATYIGTDPCTPTFTGLQVLATEMCHSIRVELNKMGSEFFIPEPESLDLCFTSPPYFDTEKYSDEPSQSYKRFSTAEAWNEGFLRKTIQNCRTGLKDGGHLVLNVANVKSHPFLEEDTVKICLEEGFTYTDTLFLTLSSIAKGGYKYEPVFVFKK